MTSRDITAFPDESPMDVDVTPLVVQALDYDVLLLIMSFAENPTVAAMMRTCSTLYLSGAKTILDDHRGVIHVHYPHIPSFCLFMLAERGSRLQLLRALILFGGEVDENVAERLLWILPKLTSLANLTIVFAEDLLQSAPGLYKGFAHLVSVRDLKVTDAGKLTCRMLRRMRSQLVSLRVDYLIDDSDFTPFLETLKSNRLPEYHPTRLCRAFSSSIEELHIHFDECGEGIMMSDCVYPKLRTFYLTDPSPRIMPYVVSFPSITHLSVDPSRREWSSFEDDFDEYQQVREENMLDQIEGDQTWKQLHEFRGDLLGLYLMAPTCQIPRLILRGVDQEHLPVLGPVLDTARPEYLQLDVHGDLFSPSGQDIPTLLRLPGCASLKELSLYIEIRKEDHLSDMMVSMGNVLESLTALPLESIQLSLNVMDNLDPTPRRTMHFAPDPNNPDGLIGQLSPPHTPSPLLPVERSLDLFDPSQYATQLADAVPTIKSVDIDVYGPRHRKRNMRSRRGENGTMVSL